MTPKHTRTNSARPLLVMAGLAAVLVIVLTDFTDIEDAIDLRFLNIFTASIVFSQGLAVLQVMWRLEIRDGGGTLPFAWCYFAIQHLVFGFGGFLVSIANQDYLYENGTGYFYWSSVITPLVLAHFAAMNAGLLGVWVGTRRHRPRLSQLQPIWRADDWPWRVIGPVCYVSLFAHAMIWLLLIDTKLGFITYVSFALAFGTNATFLLWGLIWKHCPSKLFFLTYLTILTSIEMLRGNRTFFAFPILLFGIGLLISHSVAGTKMRAVVLALPLAVVLFWGFVKSEDVRDLFSRGDPVDTAEAMARAEVLTGRQDSVAIKDAGGTELTTLFRIGQRIFELSAGDVVTRTPSFVPYWGWSEQDWSDLWTGFLPLKLNPEATSLTSETSGPGYLRAYGWTIEGEGGTTMPATLVGDSWRRFGWAGVLVTFLVWSWFLSKVTIALRFGPGNVFMALFSTGILASTTFLYSTDLITLVASMPRRLIVVWVYTTVTIGVSKFLQTQQQHRRDSRKYSVALPL